jgi:3-hydroxybutyryl-CoA dehydrogenase
MFASKFTSRHACKYVCAQCRSFTSTKRSLTEAQAAEIKKLGVVGAGQMGLGIALVASRMAKVPVTVVDNSQKSLDKGLAFAGTNMVCFLSVYTGR